MKIEQFLKGRGRKELKGHSNDVYEYNNIFYKKYSINQFKNNYGNNDLEVIKLLVSTPLKLKYHLFSDGIATEKIDGKHKKVEEITKTDISELIKTTLLFNDLKNNLAFPGIFKTFDLFKTLPYVKQIHPNEDIYIENAQSKAHQQLSLCHIDLIPNNVLFSDTGKIKLIDFEYAGKINYHFDIAAIINSFLFTKDNYQFFIDEYQQFKRIDFEYLLEVRKTLYTFWSKLCDYKYHETKQPKYQQLKKGIVEALYKIM